MSGQERGKSFSGQRDGVAAVAEHGGESGVGVDDDAVESGGEHGYRQSVQQNQRGQRIQVFVRGARRRSAASFGAGLLRVHEVVGAVGVGFGAGGRGGVPGGRVGSGFSKIRL